ncbi:AMP-binding protein [Nocardioides sp. B-3]|uniref:AMP-binding protein n=1 Tax=Nocardioides sp. B-3 TaxID=2895565 RepID=UPI00215235B7|nr:AMP-binding protein [Nocardioides sp. B-3]
MLTYAELAEAADHVAAELHEAGVVVGDKVGVRIKSGTTDLYVAILGILCAGAAYVPVDADDPDERARGLRGVRRGRGDRQRPADRESPWFRHGSFLACSTSG